jgi:membrane protein
MMTLRDLRRFKDSRPFRFSRLLVQSIRDGDTFNVAYQLGYCALFAIFPFAVFLLTLIGYVPLHGLDQEFLGLIYQFMPAQAARLCDEVIHEIVSRQRGWLLLVALGGAVWSASGGIMGLTTALNHGYGVGEARAWWKVKLLSLVMTVAATLALIVAAAGLLVGPEVVRHVWAWLDLGGAFDLVWRYLRWPLVIGSIIFMVSGFYFFLPNVRDRHRAILPGATVAVLLWIALSLGFSIYVAHFGSYAKMYGALGTVIVMLTWLYLSSAAIIVGGQINAILDRLRKEHLESIAQDRQPTRLQPA